MSGPYSLFRSMLGAYSLTFLFSTLAVGSTVFLNTLSGVELEPHMIFGGYGIGALSGLALVGMFHGFTVLADRA